MQRSPAALARAVRQIRPARRHVSSYSSVDNKSIHSIRHSHSGPQEAGAGISGKHYVIWPLVGAFVGAGAVAGWFALPSSIGVKRNVNIANAKESENEPMKKKQLSLDSVLSSAAKYMQPEMHMQYNNSRKSKRPGNNTNNRSSSIEANTLHHPSVLFASATAQYEIMHSKMHETGVFAQSTDCILRAQYRSSNCPPKLRLMSWTILHSALGCAHPTFMRDVLVSGKSKRSVADYAAGGMNSSGSRSVGISTTNGTHVKSSGVPLGALVREADFLRQSGRLPGNAERSKIQRSCAELALSSLARLSEWRSFAREIGSLTDVPLWTLEMVSDAADALNDGIMDEEQFEKLCAHATQVLANVADTDVGRKEIYRDLGKFVEVLDFVASGEADAGAPAEHFAHVALTQLAMNTPHKPDQLTPESWETLMDYAHEHLVPLWLWYLIEESLLASAFGFAFALPVLLWQHRSSIRARLASSPRRALAASVGSGLLKVTEAAVAASALCFGWRSADWAAIKWRHLHAEKHPEESQFPAYITLLWTFANVGVVLGVLRMAPPILVVPPVLVLSLTLDQKKEVDGFGEWTRW